MKLLAKIFKITLFLLIILSVIIALLYGKSDKDIAQLKLKYAPPPSAFLAMDGMDIHYRDEGNALDSLPIVLIHGTGSSLHTFNDWTAVLKNKKRVLRMDLPGFGLTGPFPNRHYSIEKYVSFINHFLTEKGITKCILAGNSLGGHIAWQFAAKHPDKVSKLILIDASGYPLGSKDVPIAFKIAKIPVLNKILTFITPRFMVRSSVENVFVDKTKVSNALVDRYFDLTLRTGNRQALVDRMLLERDPNAISLIKTIQQPTLILWGAEDLLIPTQSAYRFQKDIPHNTLSILKNVGHVPMEESPQESLAVVLGFLDLLP